MQEERIGDGRYILSDRLGSGGFGRVHRARDTRLRRTVAIKISHQTVSEDPDYVGYISREARIAANLDAHPNIATVYAVSYTHLTLPTKRIV